LFFFFHFSHSVIYQLSLHNFSFLSLTLLVTCSASSPPIHNSVTLDWALFLPLAIQQLTGNKAWTKNLIRLAERKAGQSGPAGFLYGSKARDWVENGINFVNEQKQKWTADPRRTSGFVLGQGSNVYFNLEKRGICISAKKIFTGKSLCLKSF
jgi:hypothetical protein